MSELVDVGNPAEWTLDDLALLPDDGHRYEIVEGLLLVSPPPTLPHQFALNELGYLLTRVAPPDLAVTPGVGVDLGPSMLIPDLTVVSRSAVVHGARLAHPADVHLAVEIVSPSSTTMDRLVKPEKYAEAGIPSYWRVEPGRGGSVPTIRVYDLDGDAYAEAVIIGPGEIVEVRRPFPVVLDPRRLVP